MKNSNLSDKASALVNICFMLGAAVAPVIGGALYDSIGFTKGSVLMSAICFFFACIYGVVTFCCNSPKKPVA